MLGTSEHARATPVERFDRPKNVGGRQRCTTRRKVNPIARTASRSNDMGMLRCENPVRVASSGIRFAGCGKGQAGSD